MTEPLRRGDIETDPDGSKWYITIISMMNGSRKLGRVRVGSLAHQIITGGDEEPREEGEAPSSLKPQYQGINSAGDLI